MFLSFDKKDFTYFCITNFASFVNTEFFEQKRK